MKYILTSFCILILSTSALTQSAEEISKNLLAYLDSGVTIVFEIDSSRHKVDGGKKWHAPIYPSSFWLSKGEITLSGLDEYMNFKREHAMAQAIPPQYWYENDYTIGYTGVYYREGADRSMVNSQLPKYKLEYDKETELWRLLLDARSTKAWYHMKLLLVKRS